jgi:hypothetical protein
VNINPAYRTSEVEYALSKVECKALVTMPHFKTSRYMDMLRESGRERLPLLRHIWWIDTENAPDEPGAQRFSDLLASGHPHELNVDAIQAMDHSESTGGGDRGGDARLLQGAHRALQGSEFKIREVMVARLGLAEEETA